MDAMGTVKESQVDHELVILNLEIEKLRESLVQIEEALDRVLLDKAPSPNAISGGEATQEKPLVPLAIQIRGSRQSVEVINDGVRSILNRLEL